MALKAFVDKAEYEKLPEVLRAEYAEASDGRYGLAVDGMASEDTLTATNAKLAEFRDNNIKLTKQLAQLKDIDPTEYLRLKKQAEKQPEKESDLELQVSKAVEKATLPLTQTVESLKKERDDAKSALSTKELRDSLWSVGAKAGVREEARNFWLSEAEKVFKRDDEGNLVGFNGERQLFSKRKGAASDPLGAEEWALEIAPTDPSLSILYKGSHGSGATPKTGQTTTTVNGVRVIPNDAAMVSSNLEGIASGKVVIHNSAAV